MIFSAGYGSVFRNCVKCVPSLRPLDVIWAVETQKLSTCTQITLVYHTDTPLKYSNEVTDKDSVISVRVLIWSLWKVYLAWFLIPRSTGSVWLCITWGLFCCLRITGENQSDTLQEAYTCMCLVRICDYCLQFL